MAIVDKEYGMTRDRR